MPHTPVPRPLFPFVSLLMTLALAGAAQVPAPAPAPPGPDAAAAAPATPAPAPALTPAQPFAVWLEGFIAEARTRGASDAVIQEALVGLEPLPRAIEQDRSQPEAVASFDRYLGARLTRAMTQRGRDAARANRALLDRIEKEYGVQRRFVLAIWGLESRFGRLQGSTPIFQALATLAWDPRRSGLFRRELFNALEMVDRGYIEVSAMKGSWAGAMGQTQFMPSSYLAWAVDFDADSRRDIWASTPDSLASIANYLKGASWNDEQTWGREVRVPASARAAIREIPRRTGGCAARRNMTEHRPLAEWRSIGVRRVDGGPLPSADVPAGLVEVGSRTFLVYPNYDAILAYNCAHFYALTVGLLGDSLR